MTQIFQWQPLKAASNDVIEWDYQREFYDGRLAEELKAFAIICCCDEKREEKLFFCLVCAKVFCEIY